jgi:hypothetical protein
MAPSAIQPEESLAVRTSTKKPLKASGALEKLNHFDITPVIGTEFPEANLVELLESPNSDELLRDLAIKSKLLQTSVQLLSDLPAKHGQSRREELSSSALRTTSPTTCRRNSS